MIKELKNNQSCVEFQDDNGVIIQPGALLKIIGGKYSGRIVRYDKTIATNYGEGTPYTTVGYRIYFTIGDDNEFQTGIDYHGVDVMIATKKMINARIHKLVHKTRDAATYTRASGSDVALDFFELQMLS